MRPTKTVTTSRRWPAGRRSSAGSVMVWSGEDNSADTPVPRIALSGDDLLEGLCITHLDYWQRHGSSRLAHRLYILRGPDWPVLSQEIKVQTSDGRQGGIAECSLASEFIERLNDIEARFIAKVRAARSRKAV